MAKTTSDLTKAVSGQDYDNGGAYINPNSLKIPPSTVQKINGEIDKDLAARSGVLMERFNDVDYYTA